MKTIFLTLVASVIATAAGPVFSSKYKCPVEAKGKILYLRNGTWQRFPATISGMGQECASLSVGGTSNKVEKVEVNTAKSGRKEVSLLFVDPPAVGNGESVLLKGTLIEMGANEAVYYGNIYQD